MKRLHLVYFGVLAVVALALVLYSRTERTDPHGAAKRRSDATPPPARSRPRLRLTGHVQTADGAPVEGATVFVLPKDSAGGIRDDLPHEVTDADGRFSLQARRVFGCWIGVAAPGYRNAHLDGDGVDPAVQVLLVVERAPTLHVHLRDAAGAPIARKGVQLDPWPPQTCWFLPGPTCRQGEQWAVSDARGDLVFRVATAGPVVLTPHVEGFHAPEPLTWLPEAAGEVTLTLRPNAGLHVALRDSADAPVRGLANAEFVDPATGRLVLSCTESADVDGILRLDGALRPGTYDVSLVVEGHARVVLPALSLTDASTPTDVSVTLAPAAAPATLEVRLPVGAPTIDTAAGRRRLRPPLTFFRALAGAPGAGAWTPGAPDAFEAARGLLSFTLEPGRYDLLVADVVSGYAARMTDLALDPAGTLVVEAPLAPGLRFAVRDLLADGTATRALDLRDDAGGALPVYGLTGDGKRRVSRDAEVLGRLVEGGDVQLGPYPEARVTLRALGWDGTARERVHAREQDGD